MQSEERKTNCCQEKSFNYVDISTLCKKVLGPNHHTGGPKRKFSICTEGFVFLYVISLEKPNIPNNVLGFFYYEMFI